MDLRDYLRVLRRRWLSILALVVLTTGAVGVFTTLQTPRYASTARLFVSTAQVDDSQLLQGGQFSAQRVKSYADLVTSRELAQRVVTDTGIDLPPARLVERVRAEAVLDTVNLDLTVTDTDAHRAQLVAQSYAEQLTDLVRELETPAGQSGAPIRATIVDAASYSPDPVSPNWPRNVGLGLLLGLVLGVGLAVLRDLLDTRVRGADDIAEIITAPTLGTIGFDPGAAKAPLVTDIPLHAPRAEAFRVLRTNLQFVDVDSQHKVFVVTSSVPEEGKTTTAVNLALSLALGRQRVLLVECDLRRPRAAARLGCDGAVGVTSILVGAVGLGDALQHHPETGLAVLAAGPVPPNPAELLQSNAMTELLDRARQDFDVVVIDAPPLLPVTDAALIATRADGALLVVSHGEVTREQVRHSAERLAQVDAALVGVVMNKVPLRSRSYGYGYGYAPEGADAAGSASSASSATAAAPAPGA